jgi:pyruvate/2-oxoglutarate dehydrogenase complex dihydrolipoamide dehydrogenase (E3) component
MECDVIVVGLGPGGEDVAEKLAEAGRNVVGIEAELVGGECPYWGCIPSKMMVRAADLLAEGRRIPGMAGASVITPDWSPVARRIRDEATDDWDDTVAVDRFVDKGGHFVRGRAKVTGPRTVEVNGETITAGQALVLATGATPWIPPLFEVSRTGPTGGPLRPRSSRRRCSSWAAAPSAWSWGRPCRASGWP